jgi:hypothetical protein
MNGNGTEQAMTAGTDGPCWPRRVKRFLTQLVKPQTVYDLKPYGLSDGYAGTGKPKTARDSARPGDAGMRDRS